MDTLYTFWDNITHYQTESIDFLGLMNSATKVPFSLALHYPKKLPQTPANWNMGLRQLVLGSLMLYLKGMRIMMFRLCGYHSRSSIGVLFTFLGFGVESSGFSVYGFGVWGLGFWVETFIISLNTRCSIRFAMNRPRGTHWVRS